VTSQGPWLDAISVDQAFADLVKSSWILEDVALVKHGRTEPLDVKIRKCVLDLSTVSGTLYWGPFYIKSRQSMAALITVTVSDPKLRSSARFPFSTTDRRC